MISEAVYINFLDNLVVGNKKNCISIIQNLLEIETDIKEIYTELIQKSMYRIGQMWDRDKLTITEEHVASQIITNIIDLIYPKICEIPKNGKRAVISCLDKEFHEIGPRLISDYFELNGWESVFLGANVPAKELVSYIEKNNPDVLGISINYYVNMCRLTHLLDEIMQKYPQLKIIIGGQALGCCNNGLLSNYNNIKYISSFNALDEFMNNYIIN